MSLKSVHKDTLVFGYIKKVFFFAAKLPIICHLHYMQLQNKIRAFITGLLIPQRKKTF